jgi:hypothetical protein
MDDLTLSVLYLAAPVRDASLGFRVAEPETIS